MEFFAAFFLAMIIFLIFVALQAYVAYRVLRWKFYRNGFGIVRELWEELRGRTTVTDSQPVADDLW